MKILQIIREYAQGGTERIIDYLHEGLSARGHEVYTWVTSGIVTGSTNNNNIVCEYPSEFLPDLMVIHCGILQFEDYDDELQLAQYNIPIICILHRLEKVRFHRGIVYIAVSDLVASIQDFPCIVIKNPMLMPCNNRMLTRKELGILTDEIVILRHCRFSMEKNWADFINIVSPFFSLYNIKIILCGRSDGMVSDMLQQWAREKPICILDWTQNIGDLLDICDIYVDTSLNESFGLSVSEAISYKKPIVCLKSGATTELLQELVCDDIHDARQLLSRLLESKYYRMLFGRMCYERAVVTCNSYSNFIDEYEKVFKA